MNAPVHSDASTTSREAPLEIEPSVRKITPEGLAGRIRSLRLLRLDGALLGLALCAVPVSIAISEIFLSAALLARVVNLIRNRAKPYVPRAFWFWLAWAALEVAVWIGSPKTPNGFGEIRHLLLIAALFLVLPALDRTADRVTVWRGIFLTATLSSLVLAGTFAWRLLSYTGTLDPIVYLRSGGLVHHWMIYGIIEILVFGALLEFLRLYPGERRWLLPVLAINTLAIVLSLTRMLWLTCLLVLVVHLLWRRSRWIWAVPLIPVAVFFLAPGPIRSRAADSLDWNYYPNAERIQMLRVGWKMILDEPLIGVGPGRAGELYTSYLSPSDPVPGYHGHLHNNVVQLAAEFGLPVAIAALAFVVVLFRDLRRRLKSAASREQQFLCRTAILGLIGFFAAGMFDYTYGHSLGLILLSFVLLAPLLPDSRKSLPG